MTPNPTHPIHSTSKLLITSKIANPTRIAIAIAQKSNIGVSTVPVFFDNPGNFLESFITTIKNAVGTTKPATSPIIKSIKIIPVISIYTKSPPHGCGLAATIPVSRYGPSELTPCDGFFSSDGA